MSHFGFVHLLNNVKLISFRKIMHGDLAARNILIGAGYEAKIRKQNKSTICFYYL